MHVELNDLYSYKEEHSSSSPVFRLLLKGFDATYVHACTNDNTAPSAWYCFEVIVQHSDNSTNLAIIIVGLGKLTQALLRRLPSFLYPVTLTLVTQTSRTAVAIQA